MASFGKVLDLLEERYLNLQDVIGNVEPLPTLVPYGHYKQNVLVYRMDTNHELFMGLIQDFTARMSHELGKELWTWCVQWDVADKSSYRLSSSAPFPKKPRLQVEEDAVAPSEEQEPKKPVYDVFNRCELNPHLTKEEDMLRILIDIVQVNSTIVPNFIEFLYRWIDFYEGDGKALKAALKWEIPSLWEFDYHPLVLPADVKKKAEEVKASLANRNGTEGSGHSGNLAENCSAQELAQGSPTKKMREKPDLSAFEREVEESERLQYREVKFGIQPPKFQQSLSPLINIPRDPARRVKYYAACFKSRQRAVVLLLEAGLTMQQIGNYRRMQDEDVRGTPKEGDIKKLEGLRHYYKDAAAAQEWFAMKEKLQQDREKQKEIAISSKLAIEARLAAADGVLDGPSGIPLIPPTPSYPRPPDMASDMLNRLRGVRAKAEERVNFVPSPLVGMLKSKLFEGAKDRRLMRGPGRPGALPTSNSTMPALGSEDSDEDDSGPNGSSDDDGNVNGQGAPPSLAPQLNNSSNYGARTTSAAPTHPALNPQRVAEYVRTLNPEQVVHLLPMMNDGVRQSVTNNISQLVSQQVPARAQVVTENSPSGFRHAAAGSSPHMASDGIRQHALTSSNASITPASSQPRSALMPPPPPPIQRQNVSLPSRPHLPTLSHVQQGMQQMPGDVARPPGPPQILQTPTATPSPMPQLPRSPIAPSQSQNTLPTMAVSQAEPHTGYSNSSQIQQPAQQQAPSARPILPSITVSAAQPSSLSIPSPPRTMNRQAPTPLTLAPHSPLSSLAPSLLATSPFTASPGLMPIQLYFPRIVVPGNGIGPLGQKLGDFGNIETDAFLLGYSVPGSGRIILCKAIFMPVGCWTNELRRVRKGAYQVLESYPAPADNIPRGTTGAPHGAAYAKLAEAYSFMQTGKGEREEQVTKRWRASPGPMTVRERGAVWEGWAVTLDRGIELGKEERKGAFVTSWLVDEGMDKKKDDEAYRLRRELEELEAEEGWDEDEDEMDVGE